MMRRFVLFVCACAIASAGAGQHVSAATVSGGDVVSDDVASDNVVSDNVASDDVASDNLLIEDVELFSSYDTYYGSISSTYLEYMRGYLSKLPPTFHYVGARVSRDDYLFAYGEDLLFDGNRFTGSVKVVRWRTDENGSLSVVQDNSFILDPGPYLVYTDLSDKYPGLATSADFTLRQLLILLTMLCIGLTVTSMYQVRRIRRMTKGENR